MENIIQEMSGIGKPFSFFCTLAFYIFIAVVAINIVIKVSLFLYYKKHKNDMYLIIKENGNKVFEGFIKLEDYETRLEEAKMCANNGVRYEFIDLS